MNRVITLGMAALLATAGAAMAGEPMVLTDAQLDRVTAGMNKNELIAKVAADSSRPGEVSIGFAVAERAVQNDNFLRGFVLGADGIYVKTVPGGRSNRAR
jgi:hypothetical protein